MKNWIIVAIVSLSLLLVCCNEPEEEKKYGYVLFYTNAHYYCNCGLFGVNVFVEGERVGVLNYDFFGSDSILCSSVNTNINKVLKCQYEIGIYNYNAEFYVIDTASTSGTFEVLENECTAVGVFAN